MKLIRLYINAWMGWGCALTGHTAFVCYNTSPEWIKNIWWWSMDNED